MRMNENILVKNLYTISKKREKDQFLLKIAHFNENTLKKVMFNGLLTVYFLKCMIQHADFTEYRIINPI